MAEYQNILIAVDFTPEYTQVADRAVWLAKQSGARLSLIHVVEFVHIDLANELVLPQDMELQTRLLETATIRLQEVAEALEVAGEVQQWVELGATKLEITRVAEEQNVDLIVLGSHSRHGIGLLLGSTANAVLHGAPCDVLAVRVKEN
jgi:universal stress protein A